MIRKIQARPLEAASFAGFGTVITDADRAPDAGDGRNFTWRERFGRFAGMAVSVNLMGCLRRPLRLEKLERHVKTPEVIVPVGGEPMVLAVAPAGELREEAIAAFRLEGGRGVVLHPGVWHFIPFPLDRDGSCVVVFRDETGADDLGMADLKEPVQLAP